MAGTGVIIVDTCEVIRVGLRGVLERESGIAVIGEAATGRDALETVVACAPSIVLIGALLPDAMGVGLLPRIRELSPRSRAIAIIENGYCDDVAEMFRLGAAACVLRDAPASELVIAVRQAAAGRRYVCPALLDRALEALSSTPRSAPPAPLEGLTAREQEVISLALEGLTSAEIARKLYISKRTVDTHRTNALHKLSVHRCTDLLRTRAADGPLLQIPINDPGGLDALGRLRGGALRPPASSSSAIETGAVRR